LAVMGFGAAAWKVASRDSFIGYADNSSRDAHQICQNEQLLLPYS
jgi:hypothetical protein